MRRLKITRRTRGKIARYREWLIEHPEMLERIRKEIDGKDRNNYSEETLKRVEVVKELLEAQDESAKAKQAVPLP